MLYFRERSLVFWSFPFLIVLSGCGAKSECESFETRNAVLQIVSNDHNNALATYAAKNSNVVKEKSSSATSEAEKKPLYLLGEKIVTTSTSADKRTLECSGAISATVGDTKASKEVNFTVQQSSDGKITVSVAPFQFWASVARAEAGRLKNVMAPRSTMIGFKPLPTRAGLARRSELGAYLGLVDEPGSGGTFEALPTPLGSLTELLFPPAFPGPAGTPLTPVVPEPAEPAGGVPVGLPEAAPAVDPLAAPPAPCARAAIGSIRLAAATIAIRFDFFDIGFLHIVDWVERASRAVCSLCQSRYSAGRSPRWVKIKNRTHPAMNRVREAFSWKRSCFTSKLVNSKGFRTQEEHRYVH
jgi:hypothetical protein